MQLMQSVIAMGLVSGFALSGAQVSAGEVDASVRGSDTEFVGAGHRELELSIDSGPVIAAEQMGSANAGRLVDVDTVQEPVWSTVVEVEDAAWLRLRFGQVDLSSADGDLRESYIRVTSLLDGYEQYLDFDALQVWGNTSAYFNGGSVRIEIMSSAGTLTADRVEITGVQASPSVSPASICFSSDDRVPSNDPRDARLMPIGCSAWLFGDHGSTFLSAGHCSPGGGDVIQFNVPFSTSGGGYQSPSPQDQYVVDPASAQQQAGGATLGNDWGFFGVFDNTETGMTPLEAQGDSHTLATQQIPNDGRPIRITGYGSTSSPISPTWNGVQKTHTGPFRGYSGNVVRYTTDTTGGNSGSVILDEDNNIAIGIHTNAGCGTGGGWNNGCNLFNTNLQNALANPTGIAAPRTIQGDLMPAPDFVSPDGGDAVQLVISNFHDRTIVGSPTMFVDDGSGYVGYPASMVDAVTFEGVLPAIECGNLLSYYFEILDTDGNTTQYPDGGQSGALSTLALDSLTVAEQDNFQTDTGWLVINSGVTDGQWQRRTPSSTTSNGGASADADGSGSCFVTGGGPVQDLDGGTTRILSPFYDVTAVDEPVVSFWVWVNSSEDENMVVEFSPNVGITWFPVDEISDTGGWVQVSYLIEDYVELTPIFVVRMSITDEGADSLVEGGVDGFSISTRLCGGEACIADFTGDGSLDFFDVSAFLTAFGDSETGADLTGDGNFDFFDVSAFLTAFGAGCP